MQNISYKKNDFVSENNMEIVLRLGKKNYQNVNIDLHTNLPYLVS